ncbi:carboxymuconolactone decarboxylase family protein [Breoghania sp. JC706]|uniref:carboxymuconolactone decarboxylase family protein n=1 Tax=Breoghania sp. JC706 TaxID=3117732 RepID=UPI00300B572F
MPNDDTFARGLEVRRAMFGPEGAEQQTEAATDFTWPLQDMVTRYCFGEIWNRPGLDRKQRSMITLAMLVALGRPHEIKTHVRGGLKNGLSKEEIREILVHSMLYCGIPASVDGHRAAGEVFAELGME